MRWMSMCRIGILAMAALVTGGSALVQAQQAAFRAGIDLVQVGVTVTDQDGKFIADLTADDFEIVEEGQTQTITYFARGDQ